MTKKIHKVYGSIILVLSLLFIFLTWEVYIKVSYEYYTEYYGYLAMAVYSDYVIPKNFDNNSFDNYEKADADARNFRNSVLKAYFGFIKMCDKSWNIKLAKRIYQTEEQRLWCESIRKKAFEIIEREKPFSEAFYKSRMEAFYKSERPIREKPINEESLKKIDEIVSKKFKVLDESLFKEP